VKLFDYQRPSLIDMFGLIFGMKKASQYRERGMVVVRSVSLNRDPGHVDKQP
jgi:hypothetical protein